MYTVLVFPACNEPGLEAVAALVDSPNLRVVAASGMARAHDASAQLVADWRTLPFFGTPDFVAALHAVIEDAGVDMVLVTTDALVEAFACDGEALGLPRQRRDGAPVRYLVPDANSARTCRSKSATLAALEGVVPLPHRLDPSTVTAGDLPIFAKPDAEGGGRGAMLVDDPLLLQLAIQRNLVLQEYLPGEEFTIDCLGDRDGTLLVAAPRRRSVVGRGLALACERVDDPQLMAFAQAIQARLRIHGIFFAQFRRDHAGTPRLLEVNARVGGTMGVTRLAGCNVVQLAVHQAAGDAITVPPVWPGVSVVRSLRFFGNWEAFDAAIWDLDDTLLRRDGRLSPRMVAAVVDLHNQGKPQFLVSRNADPQGALDQTGVRLPFERVISTTDKVAAFHRLFVEENLDPARVVSINDSNREKLLFLQEFPTLRSITPDAVDVLRRPPLA